VLPVLISLIVKTAGNSDSVWRIREGEVVYLLMMSVSPMIFNKFASG
jgi:hypothetical protein